MGSFATFKLDNVVDDCLRALVIVLITVLLISAPSARAQGLLGVVPPRTLDPEAGLSVILLGTGIPLPNAVRATACTGIIAGDRLFLVDTGRNCVVSLAAAGLRNIDGIFYTHYHSDHFIGLVEILLNLGIAGVDESNLGPEPRECKCVLKSGFHRFLPHSVYHFGPMRRFVSMPSTVQHDPRN